MKRIAIILAALALLVAGWWGYSTYQAQRAAQQAAQLAAEQVESDDLENVIWASGTLEPVSWAGLSPALSGTIQRIHTREGAWVERGQLLLELDNAILQSQVAQAEAAVAEAQAALDKLEAGATAAQLAATAAEVAVAQANVTLAAGQMLEVQAAIDVANAQVNAAQQQYNDLASHPTEAERTAAVANMAVAEAGLEHAQAAYNLVRWDPEIGARPESLTLRQMTAAYEAAKAEAALTTEGPTAQQLAVAASAVHTAQAQVQAVEAQAPGAEAAVKAALARQASAQAALDNLHAGATREELAMAQAHLQSAQAMLVSAQAQLRQSQIYAPFAGQIGAIHGRVGELATPGQYLVLLGDTHQMHVKTTDLRETDVVRLAPGMAVEVTFDALPDRISMGEISSIAPASTAEKGSTNYTIEVSIGELDSQLRWGMTAFVNIQTGGAAR